MLQYIRNSTQMGQCYKPRQVKSYAELSCRAIVGISSRIGDGSSCVDVRDWRLVIY